VAKSPSGGSKPEERSLKRIHQTIKVITSVSIATDGYLHLKSPSITLFPAQERLLLDLISATSSSRVVVVMRARALGMSSFNKIARAFLTN